MSKKNFCTLFDSNYLLKGVAMLQSLKKYCPDAHVYVLCMDPKTHEILGRLNLTFVTSLLLADVEDEELLRVKKDRSTAEYCWTLSSCFTWHVLQNNTSIEFITYLDADLLFYSSVSPIFDEIGCSSIAIIEHRFTPRFKSLEVNGRFCVEWVSFRRNEEGLACLSKWRNQCIEWCYSRLEDNRMGDQKYLDDWPNLYPSCHIIQNIGAGVAPWNYAQYKFDIGSGGDIFVDNVPLIFYHFHQFELLTNGQFSRFSRSSLYADECAEPSQIYEVYESALQNLLKTIRDFDPYFSSGLKSVFYLDLKRWLRRFVSNGLKNILRRLIKL